MLATVRVYHGTELAQYGFGHGHPFSHERLPAFWRHMVATGTDRKVESGGAVMATRAELEYFHTPEYLERISRQSLRGDGYCDYGDTPAFPGMYEAAAFVVGTTLDAVRSVVRGECRRAFVPIAGLHHARRDAAAGFCIFNDCGVAIESLRREQRIGRIAYVDIDAHHGDGVFYAFEDDPEVFFADIHEGGRYLYPGTGGAEEVGRGVAEGTKLNIPLEPGAGDEAFFAEWSRVENFLEAARPEFILLQCGADSLREDPLTHLAYSPACHHHATLALCRIADRFARGRLVALGGGGYALDNIAAAWVAVVRGMIESD